MGPADDACQGSMRRRGNRRTVELEASRQGCQHTSRAMPHVCAGAYAGRGTATKGDSAAAAAAAEQTRTKAAATYTQLHASD